MTNSNLREQFGREIRKIQFFVLSKNPQVTHDFSDVEQNVQLSAEQLRSLEDFEQSKRPIRHHETQNAYRCGQVSRFTATALRIHIWVSHTREFNHFLLFDFRLDKEFYSFVGKIPIRLNYVTDVSSQQLFSTSYSKIK